MIHRFLAATIFLLHAVVVLIVLFGWTIPHLWYLYMIMLAGTLLSDLVFGYCILSKWEFDLRKKVNTAINYNYTWTSYYTYRFTQHRMSDTFFLRASTAFLAGSLIINIYFHMTPTI